jgi:hypothetical protein
MREDGGERAHSSSAEERRAIRDRLAKDQWANTMLTIENVSVVGLAAQNVAAPSSLNDERAREGPLEGGRSSA